MNILQYIKSDRKGSDARKLELKGLSNRLLHEAARGYDLSPETPAETVRKVKELRIGRSAIRGNDDEKKRIKCLAVIAITIIIALALCYGISRAFKPPSKNQPELTDIIPTSGVREESVVDGGPKVAGNNESAESAETTGQSEIAGDEAMAKASAAEWVAVDNHASDESPVSATPEHTYAKPVFKVMPPDGDQQANPPAGTKFLSTPMIGRQKYSDYLKRSMVFPEEDGEGEVKLSFRVNQYGRPSEIKAEEGFSRDAIHEAIRLLSNGPEWRPTDQRVTVVIYFEK